MADELEHVVGVDDPPHRQDAVSVLPPAGPLPSVEAGGGEARPPANNAVPVKMLCRRIRWLDGHPCASGPAMSHQAFS